MFESIEEKLGITDLKDTIEKRKQELQNLKQKLCEKNNLLETKVSFSAIEFLKITKKLINYYFNENYVYQVNVNKKNATSKNYYYILTKVPQITDINTVDFWNEVEKGNIIIIATMVSKVEPNKISFMAKKQDNMAKFNTFMNKEYLDIIIAFFEQVIASKIDGTFIDLYKSFDKFILCDVKAKKRIL